MRKMLLASAALLGAALALPAMAQDNSTAPSTTQGTAGTAETGFQGTTATRPMNRNAHMPASNVNAADTRNIIAPPLPAPDVGPNATPEQLLRAAQQDVQQRRGGAAQEALERAETRLLDRATTQSQANEPDNGPAVQAITQAINAVAQRDWQAASQHIDNAMQHAQMAQGNGGMTTPRAGMTNATMPMNGTGTTGTVSTAPAMTPPAAPMTQGTSSVPMGNVMPPNGGVMPPNGGVMPPSQ